MDSPDRLDDRAERRDQRRRRILQEAATIADADGWAAVTTRRLAKAIGYTQPVLYGHFPGGKTEIMSAVAIDGFADLAQRCDDSTRAQPGPGAVAALARAYLDFAAQRPAVYEAMFSLPIEASFAVEGNEPELRSGFDALTRALFADDPESTGVAATITEVFWGALHGVSQLERAGRMRPEDRAGRIAEISSRWSGSDPPG